MNAATFQNIHGSLACQNGEDHYLIHRSWALTIDSQTYSPQLEFAIFSFPFTQKYFSSFNFDLRLKTGEFS